MILTIYLTRKFLKSFSICAGVSYSIFFIFSLIGNLGEKFPFKTIFYLSALNSFQIFTYIPSHLFIMSLCLFIIHLKSKNELIIIKEYIELKKLYLIIFPILILFIFIESKKENFAKNIEEIKSNLISSNNFEDTKIYISSDGNTKKYSIFSKYDNSNKIIEQFLSFEIKNQTIHKGEVSTSLEINESNLISNESTIYENDDFRNDYKIKEIFKNFQSFWSANNGKIIKHKENNINSNYTIIQLILFYILFYICVSMIFFSKKFLDRSMNIIKTFLLVLSIFLYFLLIPKIMLNNFQYLFQFISFMIFIIIFFKIKQYE